MKFSVTVTLKKDVLDPQGKVVQNTLINLGTNNLKSIRQGKYFEIELNDGPIIHIQNNSFRIEMNPDEFLKFATNVVNGANKMIEYKKI